MTISSADYFNKLKEEKENFYKTIKQVYCPCLKNYIYFTSDGFHHLLYKPSGRARKLKERIYKLQLLPLVIPVIKNTKGIDEYKTEKVKISRKKNALPENIEYWALIERVGKKNTRVKVIIIKKERGGKIIFWSVMKP